MTAYVHIAWVIVTKTNVAKYFNNFVDVFLKMLMLSIACQFC